ncbi:hypothetical protein FPQ18DRAFT_394844 [Pyronema domesticum]|uniref:Uncharacterized protein n=1 Tax=Pyronema omphalodes (strain CBS 100304) TaxID=1076935 RepID=U4LAV8_PYROM|nr:hypothetical protein FPQ18DRAFT_394844 [Pyronema domesticum]CCX07294.1 Protein of unknown function [Pyronema omphalodes CBS 100304]
MKPAASFLIPLLKGLITALPIATPATNDTSSSSPEPQPQQVCPSDLKPFRFGTCLNNQYRSCDNSKEFLGDWIEPLVPECKFTSNDKGEGYKEVCPSGNRTLVDIIETARRGWGINYPAGGFRRPGFEWEGGELPERTGRFEGEA